MTKQAEKDTLIARIAELKKDIENFDKSEHCNEWDFEEMLNENYEEVNVCGYSYSAGAALCKLDPVAFREEFNNWVDSKDNEDFDEYNDLVSELEEAESELESLEEDEE